MKSRPAVHQLLTGFAEGDAVSLAARTLRAACRRLGLVSEIYADPEHTSPGARADCLPLSAYRGEARDVVIHHYAVASPVADLFLASPARKVMMYHNITPARFFEGYSDAMVAQLAASRDRLPEVAVGADAVWAASGYNARELTEAGVAEPILFPLPFDPATIDVDPDPHLLDTKYREPLTNLLFVGRMAPNKSVEDLVLMYAHYYFNINPLSRLILVGSERSCPAYFAMLRTLAGELGLQNVCFERYVSPGGLAACYELSDLFVTASRHEGYCLPLLEAMHKGIPVIAREAGGMPEALDGAGVLYDDLEPAMLAELVHAVLSDTALREEILASQARRMRSLASRSIDEELKVLLELD